MRNHLALTDKEISEMKAEVRDALDHEVITQQDCRYTYRELLQIIERLLEEVRLERDFRQVTQTVAEETSIKVLKLARKLAEIRDQKDDLKREALIHGKSHRTEGPK